MPVAHGLQPRWVPTKPAAVVEPQFDSELEVKFLDNLKVRPANGTVTSAVGADCNDNDVPDLCDPLDPLRACCFPFEDRCCELRTQACEGAPVCQCVNMGPQP